MRSAISLRKLETAMPGDLPAHPVRISPEAEHRVNP